MLTSTDSNTDSKQIRIKIWWWDAQACLPLLGNNKMINLQYCLCWIQPPLQGQVWERSILEECSKLTINVRSCISREIYVAATWKDEQSPTFCASPGNLVSIVAWGRGYISGDHFCTDPAPGPLGLWGRGKTLGKYLFSRPSVFLPHTQQDRLRSVLYLICSSDKLNWLQ